VANNLQEKYLSTEVKLMVGNIENFKERTCAVRGSLETGNGLQAYKASANAVIRQSPRKRASRGQRQLMEMPNNEQTLSSIMGRMLVVSRLV
jgi:hypothetical protein